MTITYNLGIPAAANNPSSDQPNMLTNTNNIATYVAVDHVAFGSTTYPNGQHNQVTFAGPQAPSVPSNPTSILYTANDANGNPQLNFLNSQNIANQIGVSNGSSGSIILFGGLILKWGTYPDGGNNMGISFASICGSAFPNYCFQVVLSPISASNPTGVIYIVQSSITKSQFVTKNTGSGNTPITFLAIGV